VLRKYTNHGARDVARSGIMIFVILLVRLLLSNAAMLEWFKEQGPGYQSRMNAVLKAYRDASS
jgi:hypothetical protein